MRDIAINIPIKVYDINELNTDDKELVNKAIEATKTSYAPYSHFSVGAAARLENGTIITGSNQENAAYPSGTCAERTTLFYAGAAFPDQSVKTIAIAAKNEKGDFLTQPIPPCGACRQVMLETETRYGKPMRVLLYGSEGIYELRSVGDLLPLSFSAKDME